MGHNSYTPDNWCVIRFNSIKHGIYYKLLAGWSGGYLSGDSWRMNSGITNVEEDQDAFRFRGTTGSWYKCYKGSYGLRMNNVGVWDQLQQKHGDKVELMPEETDWLSIDWCIE
jgi:hypothetical protein